MRDFTQGSILKHLVLFSLPLMGTSMLQAVFGVIDAMWVGHLIGKDALAAVSAAMPAIFFLVALLMGMGMATTILVGQSYGSKNYEFLAKVLSNSFMLSLALAIIIAVFGISLSAQILEITNTPLSIRPMAQSFMTVILGGLIFSLITNWFSGVLNGVGDSKTPFRIMCINILLNIVFAPVLITGRIYIPGTGVDIRLFDALGVAGSALSTVIASAIGTVIYYFSLRHLHIFQKAKFHFKLDMEMMKKIISLGWPASLQMIIVSGSGLIIVSLANKFGADITAAYGVAFRTDQFGAMAIFSIGIALTSIVAQNIGANKYDRVKETLRYGLYFAAGLGLLYAVIVNLFPGQIAGMYTKDPAVIAAVTSYFRYAGVSFVGFGVMFCYLGVVRGAGDTFGALVMVAINLIIVRTPVCYALAEWTPMKENGLWLGLTVGTFAGAFLYYLYYKSGRWKDKKKELLP